MTWNLYFAGLEPNQYITAMKRLIVDLYIILYKITKQGSFSFIFALAYVSILNLISIYGLGFLLKDWMSTGFIRKLFSFPYYFGTASAMLLFNLWLMAPLKNLPKERKKTPFYPSLIAYTLITIVLCFYIHYQDRLHN
jgi:hypothetical protein